MGRRPRIDMPGGVHHVMNRGVDRQCVFFGDADRVEFGARLSEIHRRNGIETLAYCLMDNHFHLLVRAPDGGLSDAMQHLGLVYTRHTNDRVGRDGPLFRGRFHSIPVTTDRYLAFATRYIHRNPLDLPDVTAPGDHRWSSFRTYTGDRRCPTFVNTRPVLSLFGFDRAALERFTTVDTEPIGAIASAGDLLQHIRLELARQDLAGDHDPGAAAKAERTALVRLGMDLEATPLGRAIDALLGFPTPAARRMARMRARNRRDDPLVDAVISEVLGRIGARPAA
jgi:REP element-mobilizing transposase RayT